MWEGCDSSEYAVTLVVVMGTGQVSYVTERKHRHAPKGKNFKLNLILYRDLTLI